MLFDSNQSNLPFITYRQNIPIDQLWSSQSLLSFVLGWKVTSKITEVFLQEAKVDITLHLSEKSQILLESIMQAQSEYMR